MEVSLGEKEKRGKGKGCDVEVSALPWCFQQMFYSFVVDGGEEMVRTVPVKVSQSQSKQ